MEIQKKKKGCACEPCRKSKRGCNQQRPCLKCIQRGIADQCTDKVVQIDNRGNDDQPIINLKDLEAENSMKLIQNYTQSSSFLVGGEIQVDSRPILFKMESNDSISRPALFKLESTEFISRPVIGKLESIDPFLYSTNLVSLNSSFKNQSQKEFYEDDLFYQNAIGNLLNVESNDMDEGMISTSPESMVFGHQPIENQPQMTDYEFFCRQFQRINSKELYL
jgi:hypothetical protein